MAAAASLSVTDGTRSRRFSKTWDVAHLPITRLTASTTTARILQAIAAGPRAPSNRATSASTLRANWASGGLTRGSLRKRKPPHPPPDVFVDGSGNVNRRRRRVVLTPHVDPLGIAPRGPGAATHAVFTALLARLARRRLPIAARATVVAHSLARRHHRPLPTQPAHSWFRHASLVRGLEPPDGIPWGGRDIAHRGSSASAWKRTKLGLAVVAKPDTGLVRWFRCDTSVAMLQERAPQCLQAMHGSTPWARRLAAISQ